MHITAMSKSSDAPPDIVIGTALCAQFEQAHAAQSVYIAFSIPDDWDGTNIDLHADIYPVAGDPIANGEVVEFDLEWRTLGHAEAYDNGTVGTTSITWTQSGAGTDKMIMHTDGGIPYNDANQQPARASEIYAKIDLDEAATTYSGDPILCNIHMGYYSTGLPEH